MSSGFVSGGTIDAPIERSDEWLAAQQELEANRRRKAEAAQQAGGRSLYETLEANKAAKQEAFEEANRLKNQFRSLDEDEIEFLDSVLESTRAEEERVKKETREGLQVFRKLQEEQDKEALRKDNTEIEAVVEEEWTTGPRKRKRKAGKEGLKGVKLRKASTGASTVETQAGNEQKVASAPIEKATGGEAHPAEAKKDQSPAKTLSRQPGSKQEGGTTESHTAAAPPAMKPESESKGGLGLVDYGSDEDEW